MKDDTIIWLVAIYCYGLFVGLIGLFILFYMLFDFMIKVALKS